ncbi:SgcJ/EcaC family oxidoreductase [Saccharomonospora sp. CUA-673]|uniref:SgcJ/EcaC family oxidoreductase n=1 Tax=Saccharomonospora sp. CUA-673 TaxID=1904969 RepID=UPI0009F81FB0|nr:SgcJ/EcaC family oxidoreductase [Saccharomonospora sp. CUA-673]
MTRDDSSTSESREPRPTRRPRRRLWIVLASVVGALAILLGGAYAWLMSDASVQAAGTADCEEVSTEGALDHADESQARTGVCAVIGRLATAWDRQDAEAYGANFTETATYTTFAGTYYDGRDDIVRSHAALYDGPLSGTRLADRYLGLRFLSEDIAVLTTRGDTYDGDQPDELTKVQTYTLTRDGDDWKIAAFQNTQRKALMEQVQYRWMPDTKPNAEQ